MDEKASYKKLSLRLDSFPQGFPATESGAELVLLAHLFTPEEAEFASNLSLEARPLRDLAEKIGLGMTKCRGLIKSMGSKGLIRIGRGENGMEVALLPFVVGFFENQVNRMDEEFAQLYEAYYKEAFTTLLSVEPQFHRVIPVNASIDADVEILPENDVVSLIKSKKAWAVLDCVCRKEQEILGNACGHPIRVCLTLSDSPGAFDGSSELDVLDLEGALNVLEQAAEAGLVHTVSNHKEDVYYVCNCCTCGCSLLRGIAEANIANVVARSAYYAEVDNDLCTGCGTCLEQCQFEAISVNEQAEVNAVKCVGCGICAHGCPEDAISLLLREADAQPAIPESQQTWLKERARARRLQ